MVLDLSSKNGHCIEKPTIVELTTIVGNFMGMKKGGKHPQYKYLADSNPKNTFDVEQFLSCKLKLKAKDEYVVYEVS